MTDTIILLDRLETISKKIFSDCKNSLATTYVFDLDTHKILEQNNIDHKLADDVLQKNNRLEFFDFVTSLSNWYDSISHSKDLEFSGINLLSIMDPLEFHMIIQNAMIKFFCIKEIINQENPQEILLSKNLKDFVQPFLNNNIKLQTYSDSPKQTEYDKFEIKFNIGKKPLTVKLSKNIFSRIKNFYELLVCNLFNLWFKPTRDKKTVLLVEFNPSAYPLLLDELGGLKKNIVLLNKRRTAIWNKKSIKILRKSGCKVLNYQNLLKKSDRRKLDTIKADFSKKLTKFWSNQIELQNLFSINGLSFWPCIKSQLLNIYQQRFPDYITSIIELKNFFNLTDTTEILYQFESDETANIALKTKNINTTSFLLRHGFSNYNLRISNMRERYEVLKFLPLQSEKIFVWGKSDFDYYHDLIKINQDKLLMIGSPRHDLLEKQIHKNNSTKQKIILLTPNPITEFSGIMSIRDAIKYEKLIKQFLKTVKKLPSVKIIVKLHPGWGWENNSNLQKLIKEIDDTIPIFHIKPIHELLNQCDLMVNITPEEYDPSTVILESLIMEKPVFDIALDRENENFDCTKQNPITSLSYNANFEIYLKKILFDEKFYNETIENIRDNMPNYLTNIDRASKKLAEVFN